MQASIRVVFVSLVIGCVLVTAFVCLFLGLSAAEKALNDTKVVRDASVGECFDGSEESIRSFVDDVVQLAGSQVVGICGEYFVKFGKIVDKYLIMMERGVPGAGDPYSVMNYVKPSMWKDVEDNRNEGLSALAIDTSEGGILRYIVSNSVQETVFFAMQDPGANYSINGRSSFYALNGVNPPNVTNDTQLPPCPGVTDDYTAALVFRCKRPKADDASRITILLQMVNAVGTGKYMWGQLHSSTTAVAVTLFGAYRKTGDLSSPPFGTVYIALTLNKLQEFLRSVKIGSEDSRIFMTMRSDWMGAITHNSYVNKMTAASHGDVWRWDNATNKTVSIYPSESNDRITRSFGIYLEADNQFEQHLSMNITNITFSNNATGESEIYFYQVTALQPAPGFDWYLTIAIDRAYLLSATDALSLSIKKKIKDSTATVDSNVKSASITLYVIVVGIVSGLTGFSIVFMLWVMRPLIALRKDMYLVSMLRLDDVNINEDRLSGFVEVRDMQKSFFEMFRNIEEYKSYMPASVMMHVTDDDDDDRSTRCSDMVNAATTNTSGHSPSSCDDSLKVPSTQAVGMAADSVARALGIGDLRTRPVTYLIVNMTNFLSHERGTRIHEEYLNEVLSQCKPYKGMPDSFSGDRVHISWNAARQVTDAIHHAISFTWHLRSHMAETTFGLASASVKCGNMGCASMRRFTYLGGVIQCATLLERLNKVYRSRVLVAGINGSIRQRVHVKMIDSIVYPKYSKDPFEILETMAPIEFAEEEWMYQLEGSARSNPYAEYNSAVSAYLNQDYAAAAVKLSECHMSDPQIDHFRERVAKRLPAVDALPLALF